MHQLRHLSVPEICSCVLDKRQKVKHDSGPQKGLLSACAQYREAEAAGLVVSAVLESLWAMGQLSTNLPEIAKIAAIQGPEDQREDVELSNEDVFELKVQCWLHSGQTSLSSALAAEALLQNNARLAMRLQHYSYLQCKAAVMPGINIIRRDALAA